MKTARKKAVTAYVAGADVNTIEKAERKPDYVLKNVAEIADILKANM